MKKLVLSFAIALLVAASTHAQTTYDFTTGSSWSFTNLTVNGSNLDFTASGASSGSATFLGSAPFNSNWSAQVTVFLNPTLSTPSVQPPELASLGLTVAGNGKTASITLANSQPPSPAPLTHDIASSIYPANATPVSASSTATLKFTYSYNGGVSPTLSTYYGTTQLQSADLTTWGMTTSDTFGFTLFGDTSSGVTATAGQAYFSNFQGTGLSLSAIPEPSTWATITGFAALCFAIYRRRRHA